MSRRADAEKKLVRRIAIRTREEIAAACRDEIEQERARQAVQDAADRLRAWEGGSDAE